MNLTGFCLDHDVTTLIRISKQRHPHCTSHVTNTAASGSSNGQSNWKENGGCPPTFRSQQESPVESMQWLKSFFLAHLSTTCSGGAIVTGHRPSSVRPSICPSVNNFFKNLLLQNQKANLDKTWQECSLGEALQKLLKEFNSNKNSGCHGNKMAENGKNL